jgi:hypothetical protein
MRSQSLPFLQSPFPEWASPERGNFDGRGSVLPTSRGGTEALTALSPGSQRRSIAAPATAGRGLPLESVLPPAWSFWRTLGTRFMTALCAVLAADDGLTRPPVPVALGLDALAGAAPR